MNNRDWQFATGSLGDPIADIEYWMLPPQKLKRRQEMKLCRIANAATITEHGQAYIPVSEHKSDSDCRAAAKKLDDGDYIAIRANTPFRVKTETVKKATVENIKGPKAVEKND